MDHNLLTLPIGGQNPRDFKLFYNNDELSFQKAGNNVTIGAGDHVENRTLVLKYEVDDTEEKMFPLPETPIENTFELVSTNADCMLGNGFEVVDNILVSTCVVQEMTDFELKYTYIGLRSQFDANVAKPDQGRWQVYIDGVETSEYERVGTVITITADIPLGASVDIYYEFSN